MIARLLILEFDKQKIWVKLPLEPLWWFQNHGCSIRQSNKVLTTWTCREKKESQPPNFCNRFSSSRTLSLFHSQKSVENFRDWSIPYLSATSKLPNLSSLEQTKVGQIISLQTLKFVEYLCVCNEFWNAQPSSKNTDFWSPCRPKLIPNTSKRIWSGQR